MQYLESKVFFCNSFFWDRYEKSFSFENYLNFKRCRLQSWGKIAAVSFGKKLILRRKSIIQIQIYRKLWLIKFLKNNDEGKKKWILKQLWENKIVDWDRDGRILGSCFEVSLTFKKNHTKLVLARLALQVPIPKNQMHCLAIKQFFAKKASIDTLMEEIPQTKSETKRFDPRKKSSTLAPSDYFGLQCFGYKKLFSNIYFWLMLCKYRNVE